MKFLSVIIFALFLICSVQVQADDCPAFCPALYQPTCGYNGRCYKQFSNKCQLGYTNCSEKENFSVVDLPKCSEKSATKC